MRYTADYIAFDDWSKEMNLPPELTKAEYAELYGEEPWLDPVEEDQDDDTDEWDEEE